MNMHQLHPTEGLLLVSRDRPFPIPDEARFYRGFDGTHWPGAALEHSFLEAGLAPASALQQVVQEFGLPHASWELLYVTRAENFGCPVPGKLLGYDLGEFESGANYFSVLLNEVIVGPLHQCRYLLNVNGLLSEPGDARFVLDARTRLAMSGVDLEELERIPCLFAIYGSIVGTEAP